MGSGSAGSVRAPVSTTSSPSGARTRSRCCASFGSSSAHDSYGASTRTRSYVRVSCFRVHTASAQTTRAPVSFSFSRFCEIVRQAALSLSTNVAAGGAPRQRLDPQRARAGKEVEHSGVVDRPDQVEGGLADAIARRASGEPLGRGDPRPAMGAGDDSHLRIVSTAGGRRARRSRRRIGAPARRRDSGRERAQPCCRARPAARKRRIPCSRASVRNSATSRLPSPFPCHSSTTSKAISASGASSSRTKRAIPTVRPDSWSIAATASRPQQPTSTRCARSLSSRRGFEPRKRSRRERSERPAKTSSTGVRSPARSGLYAIEAIGFRTVERPALFRRL